MIELKPMSEAQFVTFRQLFAEDYAQLLAAGVGLPLEAARADAEAELGALLPQGLETLERSLHAVFCAETAEHVGFACWGVDDQRQRGFIHYIHVLAAYRRRGFGRAVLRWLDTALRENGATHVVLNVFAHNTAARTLYEASGYAVSNMFMVKHF